MVMVKISLNGVNIGGYYTFKIVTARVRGKLNQDLVRDSTVLDEEN